MADALATTTEPPSPITQLLKTIGLTRVDLARHSDQMREYLADHGVPRPLAHDASFSSTATHSRSSSQAGPAPATSTESSDSSTTTETPTSPAKVEPAEQPLPSRQMNSMEVVMERKSRQARREKRERKERQRASPSPSPSQSTPRPSGLVRTQSNHSVHDDTRPSTAASSPTISRATSVASLADSLPDSLHNASFSSNALLNASVIAAVYMSAQRYAPGFELAASMQRTTSATSDGSIEVHPQSRVPLMQIPGHVRHISDSTASEPPTRPVSRQQSMSEMPSTPRRSGASPSSHPPSSPVVATSPYTTPSKREANVVSSPGSIPEVAEEDRLPFTLPPGPYSNVKPETSYAALIGRAILASPGHRLTLQEIYEYITIVFPYYTREEQTWQNSVRHVLSTTACFRKCPRDRSEGKTQWAIWDADLRCFDGGGFDKRFCADMPQRGRASSSTVLKRQATGEPASGGGNVGGSRKRRKKVGVVETPPTVRPQKTAAVTMSYSFPPPPQMPIHHGPLFPPLPGNTQQQSYYDTCESSTGGGRLPAEVIFPPLPTTSGIYQARRLKAEARETAAAAAAAAMAQAENPASVRGAAEELIAQNRGDGSSPPSSSQVPELAPDVQSSSPPLASDMLSTEEADAQEKEDIDIVDLEDYVKFDSPLDSAERDDDVLPQLKKPPTMPPSPTLSFRTTTAKASSSALVFPRFATPPPLSTRSSTPPPKSNSAERLQLSAQRTPLSHFGLHMSPSPSLAHYKSHLDPPAPFAEADCPPPPPLFDLSLATAAAMSTIMGEDYAMRTPSRTPSRKRPDARAFAPVTPKRLFPTAPSPSENAAASTSGSGDRLLSLSTLFGSSSFNSPGVFDPSDPSALLDDEFARAQMQESPDGGGLYGKAGKGLLYESPSGTSPGRMTRYW